MCKSIEMFSRISDLLGYSADEALTYSAVVAVVLVHVVLGFWLFAANKEEQKKTINKQD